MLSRSEQQVADWLATGASSKEIADRLFVTEKTVKFHLTNIYRKCGVKNRTEYVVRYRGAGTPRYEKEDQFKEERGLVMGDQPTLLTKGGLEENNQGYRQTKVPAASQEAKIEYVNHTFKVTDTLVHLHGMMKEVTSKEITPATVNAACNCVARLNETINTAVMAARFLNER